MIDYTTIYSNNLEQVEMIAGDLQEFKYYVYNAQGLALNLQYSSCSVVIFKYGDPYTIIETISGSVTISGSNNNCFVAEFSGTGLSGVYQQQVKIIDGTGDLHIPAQGKIVIFPSSET